VGLDFRGLEVLEATQGRLRDHSCGLKGLRMLLLLLLVKVALENPPLLVFVFGFHLFFHVFPTF
jgi:hypothetical protein